MSRRDEGAKGGYVLVGALIVVAILVTVAAAVSTTSARSARAWHDRAVAVYAAESGIIKPFYRLVELIPQPHKFMQF